MIKTIKTLGIVIICLGLSNTQVLADELSCDDLVDIANTAEEVRDALVEIGTITEGDEVDTALSELIDALGDVAEYEGNSVLADQIETMDEGWEDMDGDTLMSGLQGAINSVDTLIDNDCQ